MSMCVSVAASNYLFSWYRALCVLCKTSTTELYPQILSCPGWSWIITPRPSQALNLGPSCWMEYLKITCLTSFPAVFPFYLRGSVFLCKAGCSGTWNSPSWIGQMLRWQVYVIILNLLLLGFEPLFYQFYYNILKQQQQKKHQNY